MPYVILTTKLKYISKIDLYHIVISCGDTEVDHNFALTYLDACGLIGEFLRRHNCTRIGEENEFKCPVKLETKLKMIAFSIKNDQRRKALGGL